jgi:tyrosyl-tRNA synthetase
MKIDTDLSKIDQLLTRGVENIYPNKDYLKDLLKSGKQLTLYTGYDPTSPTLHIGHGITMLKLREFQELGHKVIMLIGDFTGMIGDPTDKLSTRKQLTREQVLENCREYKKQAGSILDFEGKNPVEVKYNSEWLSKMNFADIIELASHFTVQQMLERDMFQKRIGEEKPVFVHEFMYPMMQGYDSVAMDVDGEVGGNDQTFNMLAGRDLMSEIKGKNKFVLTTKLLVDSTGAKMGKTTGNAVSLDQTPEDMFGKVMSWGDDMIVKGLEICTRMDIYEIKNIEKELKKGGNPRDYKLILAYEVVKTFLGDEEAKKGKEYFINTFSKKEIPADIPELLPSKNDIITVLIESKICKSTSEARQNIAQGGVKINEEKVTDIKAEVKKGDIVQKGSRFFVKIV